MKPTTVRQTGKSAVVLAPSGNLDVVSSSFLRAQLAEACDEGLPVVVDLSGVTFIDSIALGVLLAAHRRLLAGGCHLTLTGASGRVQTVLQITGLKQLFGDASDGPHAQDTTVLG